MYFGFRQCFSGNFSIRSLLTSARRLFSQDNIKSSFFRASLHPFNPYRKREKNLPASDAGDAMLYSPEDLQKTDEMRKEMRTKVLGEDADIAQYWFIQTNYNCVMTSAKAMNLAEMKARMERENRISKMRVKFRGRWGMCAAWQSKEHLLLVLKREVWGVVRGLMQLLRMSFNTMSDLFEDACRGKVYQMWSSRSSFVFTIMTCCDKNICFYWITRPSFHFLKFSQKVNYVVCFLFLLSRLLGPFFCTKNKSRIYLSTDNH